VSSKLGRSCVAGVYGCILASLLITACAPKRQAQQAAPHYAIARFENLSGDPSLEWLCRALDESLPVSLADAMDGPVLPAAALTRAAAALGQRPASAPGISTEQPLAIAAGANHLVTGYIERVSGTVRVTAVIRDLATGKSVRTAIATGGTPYSALVGIGQQLSTRAKPAISMNPAALEAYASAIESASATGLELFDRATSLDPNFGAAWVARERIEASRNDRAAALGIIEHAKQQRIDAISLARLDLDAANLKGDRTATIAAMRKVASLTPADTAMLRNLIETETAAGDFKQAAADWSHVAATEPADALVWNALGYVRSYAGDYAGALDALQHYDRLRPQDANPLDSIGDLNYVFRKFKEAAANYMAAERRQPGIGNGSELYKAAWATFKSGDTQAADKLIDQFRAVRAKTSPAAADIMQGDWLFRTGRRPQAFALLRKFVAETKDTATRIDALTELAIWDLIEGDRAQAAKDAAQIQGATTSVSVAIARFAALPSATPAEWEARSRQAGSLAKIALGYALLFDGKREAATQVWADIVRQTTATDFLARAIYAQLQGKPPDRPLLPQPENLNPFAAAVKE
jgi:Flp pilus assembly protein TadD/TolB-like protein